FAVNKLDAVADPAQAFANISGALTQFAQEAGIAVAATIPVSALKGYNVVNSEAGWAGYQGPSLLQLLEQLPNTPADTDLPLAFPVQWVEKFHDSAVTTQGRRVFWGRVATGSATVGAQVQILPSGQLATIAQVIDHARAPKGVPAGLSAGITLDREVDVSRGDWIVAAPVQAEVADDDLDTPAAVAAWPSSRSLNATVAWMDNEPLVPGRVYWTLHGHRWVKAKAQRVVHRLDINTLAEEPATQLDANAIGVVEFALQEAIPTAAFTRSRALGSLILVDTASNATAAAVLVR
ncbi:MAG: sulfate adenylyltransferase, partial [Comamonas sp.]|nr:sulfate adenylyltransferase [Candidatus Comamonas equi]